ncbi:MAG: ATP-binding protein [Desulfovibrionales bacterium]|nr:ATP-binding protein [Desulfovibrionales bacterium]
MKKMQEVESLRLQNAHLQRALQETTITLQEKIIELSVITRISACLEHIHALQSLSAKVVTIIAEETVAENCSIMLLDNEQSRLYLLAANDQMDKRYLLDSNAIGDKEKRLYSFSVGEGVAGTALKEGKAIYVPDTAASGFFTEVDSSRIKVRSLLAIPLVVNEKAMGVINLSHPDINAFTDNDVRIMQMVANFTAAVINNALLHNELSLKNNYLEKTLEELSAAQAELLQAQKMESLGIMAGGIAHDFNNILVGILGYASLLKNLVAQDAKLHKYVDTIETSASRGAQLTQQLLLFARSKKTALEPANLNTVIREILALFSTGVDKKITIEKNLAPDIGMVDCDSGQMHQALLNIVINARDAVSENGKITITSGNIYVEDTSSPSLQGLVPGNYVLVSIADNGQGMDKETVAKIFDPFFTTKEKGKGTGLGLSMVYNIIKKHRGAIEVTSEIGKGATFNIYLPHSSAQKTTVSPLEPLEDKADHPQGHETLLLVDDEEVIRGFATEILSAHGYQVIACRNGREALEIYAASPGKIDLVILDLFMPVMDGKETLAALKKINPQAKVVISSGYAETKELKGLEGEICAFIHKPYKTAELLKKAREVLDRDKG